MNANKHLIVSGVLFAIVLFLWPIFMAIAQPAVTGTEQQLYWVMRNLAMYRCQFILAFLIAPLVLYMMSAQLDRAGTGGGTAGLTGRLFLAGYLVLNSISYASQIVLVPGFMRAGMVQQAGLFYFGSEESVVYFLNQMGYAFWAVGAIILFVPLVRHSGMIRYISGLYLISALLSIAAFAGLMADSKVLNSLTLYSGLILAPVGILTAIWGIREQLHKE